MIGAERRAEGFGPRAREFGAESWGRGLGPSSTSINATTGLPGGASKLKSRDAAAATGGLYDSPRRHAAAATATTAAATAAATAAGPLHAPPRRCKQWVALPPPRRCRRGRLELHADDDRQQPSSEPRGRRDRSEIGAAKSQQLQHPAIYHPTAGRGRGRGRGHVCHEVREAHRTVRAAQCRHQPRATAARAHVDLHPCLATYRLATHNFTAAHRAVG